MHNLVLLSTKLFLAPVLQSYNVCPSVCLEHWHKFVETLNLNLHLHQQSVSSNTVFIFDLEKLPE